MIRSLERRVKQLEESAGGGCPECSGPDAPGNHTTYELVFVEDAEEEWCETCGRQTGFVVRWPEDLS